MIVLRNRWKLALVITSCLLAASAAQRLIAQTETAAPTEVPQQYQVPNSQSVDELGEYLTQMLSFEPKTNEEAQEYQRFAPEAMTEVAQRILQLETDTNSDSFLFAQKYLLAVDVMAIDQATPEEKQQLSEIIQRNLAGDKMDADDLDIAVAFAEGLEMTGDVRGAIAAYNQFAGILKNHKDPLVLELGQLMEGSARRLSLAGNTIEVAGTTLDGQAFNWSAYRGKTVLIDFWATWCGPCRAEMPQIKEYYDAYRSQGFEVVGICLDEDRAKVDEFLSDNEVPWVTLFEPDGRTNPTAVKYGITALPTSILVDPQGQVVSLAARGEDLGKLLTKMFGPAK